MATLINRIDSYRKLKRIKIKEISERTNVSYAYLTRVFSGKCNISVDKIEAILNAIGLELVLIPKEQIEQ